MRSAIEDVLKEAVDADVAPADPSTESDRDASEEDQVCKSLFYNAFLDRDLHSHRSHPGPRRVLGQWRLDREFHSRSTKTSVRLALA